MILDGQNVLKKHLFQNFQHVRSSWYNEEKKICVTFTLVLMIGYQKNSIQTILYDVCKKKNF